MSEYEGLLLIGDPHAASKVVGFRKDDYPRTVLRKLEWSLAYARAHRLLPLCLGDLFHVPRDNANWLLGELLRILGGQEFYGIYGNHDCREGSLKEDDSLSVLVAAGAYRLLSLDSPWRGRVAGRQVAAYGISWNVRLSGLERAPEDEFVLLLTHHDVGFPEYEQGHEDISELEGVDLVVNGHIHRRLPLRSMGKTRWLNPGNISRVSRGTQECAPSVLVLRPREEGIDQQWVEIPHEPYDDVFYESVSDSEEDPGSVFVRGLADLQARRTQTGAGLREFLDQNLDEFEPDVREEIQSLAAVALGD